jgi:hypothetical protein
MEQDDHLAADWTLTGNGKELIANTIQATIYVSWIVPQIIRFLMRP